MSLIAWLPLNGELENKGSNKATFSNSGATLVSGGPKFTKCYSFDGSNDYISANLPVTQYMTFTLWIKFNTDNPAHIIDFRTASSASTGLQPAYGGTGYGLQVFSTAGGSKTYSAADCGFVKNTWYHLAIIYTPTYCNLYINGVSKGKTNGTYTNASLGTQSFRLGTRASNSNWFNGMMSDVRVYDEELSADAIKYLYNRTDSKLIHLTFNDADFVITNKMYSCGMKNTSFITTGITKSTDTILGDACGVFSSGYIYQSLSNLLTATSNFSVSTWIYQTATGTTGCLFSYRTTAGGGPAIFLISGTTVRFDTVNSSFSTALSNPYNTWHLITCTYDGVNRKIYIDGELKNTVATTSIGSVGSLFSIGQSSIGSTPSGNAFGGRIADWCLYNYALTDAEVSDLYNSKCKLFKNGILETKYFQDNSSDIIFPDKKGNIKADNFKEGKDTIAIYKTKKIECLEMREE